MKKIRYLLLLILFGFITSSVSASAGENDRVIKILAIGNSFSADALEQHFYDLAKAEGIEVIIGNMYIGGSSLKKHLDNAIDDKPAYSYRKIGVDGKRVVTKDVALSYALADEAWDYVSFQQQSGISGQYETWIESLPQLIEYVKSRLPEDVVMMIHQTWAYDQTSTHKHFVNYDNDQMVMYNSIMSAVKKVSKDTGIKMVIPSGTAVQNARTTSLKDTMTRDGYHLHKVYGRYVAACTWFEVVFNKSVIGNSYKPEDMTAEQCLLAQKSAHQAVQRPYKTSKIK